MLRSIKSPNRRARLIGFSATTAAAAANTVQVGSNEGTFTNASADEQLDFVPREVFSRNTIVVCTPGASIGDGGTAVVSAAATGSAISVETINGSASADVGGVEALVLGYDNTSTDLSGKKENLIENVRSSFRNAYIVAGQVASDGTKSIGGSTFTCVKDSTGNYTVTFTRAFGRVPTIVVTPFVAGVSAHVKTKARNSFTIATFNAANSAADAKFNFVAFGSASIHEHRSIDGGDVEIGFRKPRMFGGVVDYSAGTPSITIGAGLFTITDTGTGQLDVAYAEKFAREPIVVASCHTAARWATLTSAESLSTGVRIESAGSTGTLTDPTGIHFIVIGSDDASEY
jgi:hypothetical protein